MDKDRRRIYYLDVMRGLAVFFMILQHAMIMHEFSSGEADSILGNIIILLGTAPAAPVFLLIMGIFLAKSKKSTKENVIRGIKLFLFGFIFNFIRFVIPAFIAGSAAKESYELMEVFLEIDIFQAAGLSIIVGTLLKKWSQNRFVFPAIITAVLLISPYLWGIADNSPALLPLTGTGENVAFPFFPWVVYPLLGMYLSPYLTKQNLDKSVKKCLGIASALLFVLGISLSFLWGFGDYNRGTIALHMFIISFIFAYILLCEFITQKTIKDAPGKIYHTLFFWSENVTGIYIVQWIIFGYSILAIGMNNFSALGALIIGLAVTVITHFLMKAKFVKKLIPKI